MTLSGEVVEAVRDAYRRHHKPSNLMDAGQFEKGGETQLVLRTPVVRAISAEEFRRLSGAPKREVFEVCNALLDAGFSLVAFDWVRRVRRQWAASDFGTFESWIERHVTGWGACDDICCGPLGMFFFDFPSTVRKSRRWARSENMWFRRASAVALIYSLRRGAQLEEAFQRADLLLLDPEDLVQKGYGWMLKEATKSFPDEVFWFVMDRRDCMPRTALRYAIEKLPQSRRTAAMKRPAKK